jgi:hypothetical protein
LSEGGKAAPGTSQDHGGDPIFVELREAKNRIGQLLRALGQKT